jgi:hypothetical protein
MTKMFNSEWRKLHNGKLHDLSTVLLSNTGSRIWNVQHWEEITLETTHRSISSCICKKVVTEFNWFGIGPMTCFSGDCEEPSLLFNAANFLL